MNRLNMSAAAFLLLVCFTIFGTRTSGVETSVAAETAAATAQDPASLDRRISMLEQRFYFLEANLRRLETQVAARPTPAPDQQAPLLRNEIEALKGQIQIINCALAKLDERTLSPNLRQSAREGSSYRDPCRLNPETPLRVAR
ncbi:MAG: hypothetical protein ACRD6N_03045 [Pyrinomonadaceae bacterium]